MKKLSHVNYRSPHDATKICSDCLHCRSGYGKRKTWCKKHLATVSAFNVCDEWKAQQPQGDEA